MEHIVGGDGHQVLAGDGLHLGQTVVLGHQNVLEQVADAAGIAEAGVGALFSDVVADQGLGLRREDVALAAAHFEDLEHLLRGVVLEQQETVEAALYLSFKRLCKCMELLYYRQIEDMDT